MKLEPEEKALVEVYLQADATPNKRWEVLLLAGLAACVVLGVLLLVRPAQLNYPFALAGFVLGLVVMARAMDDRKRALLAGIIQKYDRAVREGGSQQD